MILETINRLVDGYPHTETERVEGNFFQPYDVIKTVEYYTDSKYLGGMQDALGRDKPFYNIVNYRLNTAYKATPFATKDMQLVPDGAENALRVALLNHELHDWFKESNYDSEIDRMRWNRAKHGELIVKKTEKGGDLKIESVDLRNVVVDPTNLYNVFIEIHYMSPSELAKQTQWDLGDLLTNKNARKRTVKNAIGSEMEVTVDQYEVYEVYGEFPESELEEDGDENKYSLYRIYATDDQILDIKKINEFPYKNLAWEEVSGRSLGRGVVEDGIQAQVWSNDAVLKERDMMEHASKIVFTTDDEEVEDNILTDYDSGQIVHVSDGRKLSMLNNVPSSLPQIQSILNKWDSQYERAASSFDSVTGETMPSRTPFRTVAMLQQAGNSSFAEKNKAFGILQKEILYDWILPHLIKKLKGEHLLVLDFTKEEVDLFADDFATYEINQFLKKRVLSGEKVTKEQYDALLEHQKSNTTTRRTMKIPAGYYDNIRTKVDIITTGENQDKAAMMESLNTLLITVAQNPQVISDPALSKLFGKIIDLSGIGVSLPELAANVNQNVDPNQQSIPGQADASGVEGVQPGGLG